MNCVSQGFPTAWFNVVSVQGSGLMELLLKLPSDFEVFSWKTLPRLTFPVVLFSCLVLWPHSPRHSCFILIVERIQLSPVFVATTKWSFPSHPLCWNHTCSQDCCPAVHTWKQKKRKFSLSLVCENTRAIASMALYRPSSGSATALFVFTAKALYAYF